MPALYANPALYVFLATLAAFVLLMLTTVSVPVLSMLAFLHSTQANGVKFGLWGWCLDDRHTCSPVQFGYTWPPEISTAITKAFVFYPIAIVFAFFTLVALVPVLCTRGGPRADRVFLVLAWLAFGTSALAFLFMIGIVGVTKARFERRGFSARYGNLTWMSLSATILLFVVLLSPYFLGPPPKPKGRRIPTSDIESRRTVKRWSKGGKKERISAKEEKPE